MNKKLSNYVTNGPNGKSLVIFREKNCEKNGEKKRENIGQNFGENFGEKKIAKLLHSGKTAI